MLLGILSDSHGHLLRTRTALHLLIERGAGRIIHCGDIGSEAVLVEMAASVHPGRIPVDAVLGNVDLINREISDFPADAGVKVHGRFADLTLHDKRVAVVHGDDRRQLEEAIASGRYDYLLTGHTHVADDRMGGRTRVINPGAVYRAASPSVATLHLATGRLRRYELAN